MPVLKYDNSDVDRSKDFKPADVPSVGLHRCQIKEIRIETPKGKDKRMVVLYVIAEPTKSKGYPLYSYINLEMDSQKWKLDQLIRACGQEAQKGSFNTDKQVGKFVTVRVVHEPYNDEMRGKPAGVWSIEEDEDEEYDGEYPEPDDEEEDEDVEEEDDAEEEDEEEDSDDEEEDDSDEEDEEEEPAPAKKAAVKKAAPAKSTTKKAAAKPKPEPEPEPEEDEEDGDYSAYSLRDLREDCEARGLSPKGPRSALEARLRANDADPFAE